MDQFADDADIFSQFDQQSINGILQTLEDCRDTIGLQVNYDKTTIYRIGALKKTNAKLYTQHEIQWTSEKIEVLGITICNEKEATIVNYAKTMQKVTTTLNLWRNRSLSLFGKINIFNTLIGSLFTYQMMVLPSPPMAIIKKLESECLAFLWNGKKSKISLNMLQAGKKSGGAKLINLRKKDKTVKIMWIQILKNDSKTAKIGYCAMGTEAKHLEEDIWSCNLHHKDVETVLTGANKFWTDVVKAWCEISYGKCSKVSQQRLWLNSNVRIAGKPCFILKAWRKGLKFIAQLYPEGALLTFQQAKELYDLDFIQLTAIHNAIPKQWKQELGQQKRTVQPQNITYNFYRTQLITKQLTKTVYEDSIVDLCVLANKEAKWSEELGEEVDLAQAIGSIYAVTNVPKLRSFQYRLIHRAIITNIQLVKWGKAVDNKCVMCHREEESYSHLFVNCEKIEQVWTECKTIATEYTREQLVFNERNIMFNSVAKHPKNVANFIVLLLKIYIYRCRCLGTVPNRFQFKAEVHRTRNIEKYIAQKNGNMDKYRAKWKNIEHNLSLSPSAYIANYLATHDINEKDL